MCIVSSYSHVWCEMILKSTDHFHCHCHHFFLSDFSIFTGLCTLCNDSKWYSLCVPYAFSCPGISFRKDFVLISERWHLDKNRRFCGDLRCTCDNVTSAALSSSVAHIACSRAASAGSALVAPVACACLFSVRVSNIRVGSGKAVARDTHWPCACCSRAPGTRRTYRHNQNLPIPSI